MIYLDNAATTRILPEVLNEMYPWLTDGYGNPDAVYSLARSAKKAVETARERVAAAIGADPASVIFTSGGTESNNMALKSFGRDAVCATDMTEHDSVLRAASKFFDKPLLAFPVNADGTVEPDAGVIEGADADIVSVMGVNNETGVTNDISKFADIAHEHGAMFHTDCVQAFGNMKLDVDAIGCDFMSLSSHKVHGPKGVGALYVRFPKDLEQLELVTGGEFQESGLRGGTLNVPGIVGFGKACEIAVKNLDENRARFRALRESFNGILAALLGRAGIGFGINGRPDPRSKTENVYIEGADAETMVLFLDARGVCVSAGSACHSHESDPSRTLTAMGLSPERARQSLRISFSSLSTEGGAEEAARQIAAAAKFLVLNDSGETEPIKLGAKEVADELVR